MSNKEKIVLTLNVIDAACVSAAIHSTIAMMKRTIKQAIVSGDLAIAQISQRELDRMENIVKGMFMEREFTSDTFDIDMKAVARGTIQDIESLKSVMNNEETKNAFDECTPEKGKKWEAAEDNVINILDSFKAKGEDKSDE